MERLVLEDCTCGVLELRLNRPAKKNALTPDMYMDLAKALARADADSGVRAVWITGSGDSFSSGNDVTAFTGAQDSGGVSPALVFMRALAAVETPIVAAVNGIAVGIGATMLLHCDIVHAAENAFFRFPFVDLGVFPEAASTILLPRVAGYRRAMEMFLLAERFDAAQAREAGIVSTVFGAADLETESLAIARRLALKPPGAVRETRARMRAGLPDLRAVIDEETGRFGEMTRSPEAQEAFNAFLEKRTPDFSRFR